MSTISDARPVVIVLEPEILVRMTIAEFLRDCGYKVIEGAVSEDLWSVIKSGSRLDVVFTEVRLANDGDGFELARRLRTDHPGIDVILTSSVPDAAEKSKNLCEEGPMKKPYRSEEVANRIKLLLERRRTQKPKLPAPEILPD
jgi:DNA-binding response OmpR family regulator